MTATASPWRNLSLRRLLLLVLLPGMLLVIGAELMLTWRTAQDAAQAAYDRSLLGAMKSIDANITTESGGLGVELPYRMLEFFELTANGQVYFRVSTEDGLVQIGHTDLPPFDARALGDKPAFTDARYFDQPVRLGTYARRLNPPLPGQPMGQRVVIQVAETLESRHEFSRSILAQAVLRDLLLLGVAALLLAAVVGWSLMPLDRLRADVGRRSADDLNAITTDGIPADVRPLVEAINHHIERNRHLMESRRRFVDDASHQLRTPLTTLAAQVGYALREPDPVRQRQALEAIRRQLDDTVRQTNQMLALARTDSAEFRPQATDVSALATELTRAWWATARDQGVDLGLDVEEGADLRASADPGLLREALVNLLHNAVRYTPQGGHVTVGVHRQGDRVVLSVEDNGPGIPPDELPRAGERFFRARNVQQTGSGLGLAIVRSITERHGGLLCIRAGADGKGLSVSLSLPVAPGVGAGFPGVETGPADSALTGTDR